MTGSRVPIARYVESHVHHEPKNNSSVPHCFLSFIPVQSNIFHYALGQLAAAADHDEMKQEIGEEATATSEEERHKPKQEVAKVASYSAATHAKSRYSDSPRDIPYNKPRPNNITPPTPNVHDKSFLRGSSSYTIVDTTVSAVSPVVISIHPTSDATVHSNDDRKAFLGDSGELTVGPSQQYKSRSMCYNDALIKFDLMTFSLDERRNYRAANRAVLRLFSLMSSPSGGIVQLASSNKWDERDVTWSTAPKMSHALASIGRTHPNSWIEVDVTSMLLFQPRSGANHNTVTLRITRELTNHSWLAKYSSKENEAGYPAPELRVYF